MIFLTCIGIVLLLAWLAIAQARAGLMFGPQSVPALSSNSIICVLFLIYVVGSASLPILDGLEFTWAPSSDPPRFLALALLLALLALVTYSISYRVFRESGKQNSNEGQVHSHAQLQSSQLVIILLLVVGVLIKFYLLYRVGGAAEAVTRMSSGLREQFGLEELDSSLTILRSLSSCADLAASMLVCTALFQRRRISLLYIAIFCAVLTLTYLVSGKRTLLIELVLAIGLAYSLYVRAVSVGRLVYLIPVFLLAGWGTLALRSTVNMASNNIFFDIDQIEWAHGSSAGLYFYSLEFAFMESLALCIERAEQMTDLFGGRLAAFYTTSLEPVLYFIPRALWSGKPAHFWDFSHAVTAEMFSMPLNAVSGGVAPSYIGSAWAIGGPIGVVVYSILLGFIAAKADRYAAWHFFSGSLSPLRLHYYVLCVFACFVLWRQGGLGFAFLSVVTSQLGYIIGLLLLSYNRYHYS